MKSLLIWAGILLALVLVVQMMGGGASQSRDSIPYSDFLTKVDDGPVRTVSIGKDLITGRLADKRRRSAPTRVADPDADRSGCARRASRFDGAARGDHAASGCSCSTSRCPSC